MNKNKKKFYAVGRGQKPGIYQEWYGENGAEIQIKEFPGARFKKFSTLAGAQEWLTELEKPGQAVSVRQEKVKSTEEKIDVDAALNEDKVIIYTDGGCLNNPGPGGYGAVLLHKNKKIDEVIKKELAGGFRLTTNNRMELTACIEALKSLKKEPSHVLLFSDSRYVVNGITKGWAQRWRKKGWMRTKDKSAENPDLWAQLLDLCEKHKVDFAWVKGHAGNPGNERCDELATQAANDPGSQSGDIVYETGKTTVEQKTLFP
jgi:ribonuclease HI